MNISIGSDHAGFELKEDIKKYLAENGFEVRDSGAHDKGSCDYPDYALEVAESVASGESERGILICKTGIGMAIAANKVPGIRAALCKDEETAKLSRAHNDANVLALEGDMKHSDARGIVKVWLATDFTNDRHSRRIGKIHDIEKKYSRPSRMG